MRGRYRERGPRQSLQEAGQGRKLETRRTKCQGCIAGLSMIIRASVSLCHAMHYQYVFPVNNQCIITTWRIGPISPMTQEVRGWPMGAQLKHGGAESQKKDVCFQSPELQTLHSAGGFLELIARSRSGQVWKKRMTV